MKRPRADKPSQPSARRPHRRRWVVAAAVPVVLLGAVLVATRSPVAAWLVLPSLGRTLGAKVEADSVRLGLGGTHTLRGVRVRVPGIDGPAGTVFEADRLAADVRWLSIFSGSPVVERLHLDRPLVRLSVSDADGTLNAGVLRLPAPSGKDGALVLPKVSTREAALELGEHGVPGVPYTALLRVPLMGEVTPLPDPSHEGYTITLREAAPPRGGRSPIALSGAVDKDGRLSLSLERVLLEQWSPSAVPSRFRRVFEAMDLRGAVAGASFSYDPATGVLARVDLERVALTLPFEDEGKRVRMHDTSGSIAFTTDGFVAVLTGIVGDLRYDTRLIYTGFEPDSPFECVLTTRGFRMEEQPALIPLAPEIARRWLGNFSNPTGLVDAEVRVSRAEPTGGQPAPVIVRGVLDVREGTASFVDFPYRFGSLEGRTTFDEHEIRVERVIAVAPTGARLRASGVIRPPRVGASVDIVVEVEDVPVDGTLLAAMSEGRRRLVEALFSRERYEEIVALGLVLTPARAEELRRRVAEIEQSPAPPGEAQVEELIAARRALEAPVFEFGARAGVRVHVTREEGDETDYERTIEVRLPNAGLVPEHFPLPIVARGAVVVIDERYAVLERGEFTGAAGGRAEVAASADVSSDLDVPPEVEIVARAFPIDARLIHALPGPADRPTGEGVSLKRILTDMRLRGSMDCVANIWPREDGALAFSVDAALEGVEASPLHAPRESGAEPFGLRGLTGTVAVTQERLALRLAAAVPPASPGRATGSAFIDADVRFAPEGTNTPTTFTASVEARSLDLSLAIEDAASVFSPNGGAAIADLRARYRPAGIVDGIASFSGTVDSLGSAAVVVTGGEAIAFDALDGRVLLDTLTGVVRAEPIGAEEVVLDNVRASVAFAGEDAGRLVADGRFPMRGRWGDGHSLAVHAEGWGFEHGLTRRVLRAAVPGETADTLDALNPRGRFDALLQLTPPAPAIDAEGTDFDVRGTISPRSLSLTSRGVEAHWPGVSGSVTFTRSEGRVERIVCRADGWTLWLDGSWVVPRPDAISLSASISLDSPAGLADAHRALLPPEIDEMLRALAIAVDGPLTARSVELSIVADAAGTPARFRTTGLLSFADASLNVGAPVTHVKGAVGFRAERTPELPSPEFRVDLAADSLRVAGIDMTDGRARVESGTDERRVVVPLIVAHCHGGRMTGAAVVHPLRGDAPGRDFEAQLRLVDVPLVAVLADWDRERADLALLAGDRPPPSDEPETRWGGTLCASLDVAGRIGEPRRTTGRGQVIVTGDRGARVLDLPLILPLIEFSNLAVPTGDTLSLAEAEFYVRDGSVFFERLLVSAPSVEIVGFGSMSWPRAELDLRFNSRRTRRVPLLSPVIEAMRDEIITTAVRGTLGEPRITAEQFTGTRQLLARLAGRRLSESEEHLRRLERDAREEAERRWRVTPAWRSKLRQVVPPVAPEPPAYPPPPEDERDRP